MTHVSDPLALQNAIARSRTTGPGLLPVYRDRSDSKE